jgi:mRNA interferase MazF
MTRGDIVTVDLPEPSTGTGHEQMGYRPAIVVQTDITDAELPTTMIVPLTSNLSAMRFPHTLRVEPSPQNGLIRPSVLLVFQLRAIDKRRIGNNIGHLEHHYLEEMETEMRRLLGI